MNNTASRLKKIFLASSILILVLAGWVMIANIHSKNMTIRQKILNAFYPVVMAGSKWFGKATAASNDKTAPPPVSFYSLSTELNGGSRLDFSSLKGKKVLLVNTASDCGFTGQYAELEKLHRRYGDRLVVIGFPANDFKEQEKGSDEQIAQFCQVNFGVSFPLAKKSRVIKGTGQNPVFRWLTDKTLNGWNEQEPQWNFSKYLVDENGVLENYFASAVSPLSEEFTQALNKN